MMQQQLPRLRFAKSFIIIFLFSLFLTPSVLEAQITGSVFRDYNANGMKETNEPFVSGITVTAYGSSGTACGTTTTSGNSAPNYSLTGCGTAAVRVEFSIPSSGSCANSGIDFTALGGATYGSSVQFVTGNSTNVHFAINNPADYTASTSTPKAYIPCYVGGNPLGGGDVGTDPWFVGFPYSNSGTTAPTLKLDGTTVGATWGVAYSKQAQKIFTSAFVKRHVGLGSMGSGGIYMLTPTASSFTVTQFYDMDAHGYRTRAASGAPAYGEGTSFTMNGTGTMVTYLGATDAESGAPVGLGVIGNNGGGAAGTDRELPAAKNNPSYDPAAFDQVGKVSLGGLEISDDGKFLFVVNLYDRKVYRLELNDAANPTSVVSVTSYALPSVTANNGVLRPFANKFYKGKLYVGAVTTGENGGQNIVNGATDLYAYIFELENATASATFNSTPTITYPLNYRKGEVELIDGSGSDLEGARWVPWTNNTANAFNNGGWIVYPSPMLSDLDFTERGDLMMAFTDRGGHQWGNVNYINLSGSTQTTIYEIGGDLLIAGKDCTTGNYTLESNGSYTSNGQTFTSGGAGNLDGPGGGEFFNFDKLDPWHYEIGQGAVALLPGQDKVLTTVFDPIAIFSGGTVQYSLTDGTVSNAYQLYVGTSASDNGKSNGLGDLELSSTVSPIEIGNRVWNDSNNNGIQDAGESGIGNVTVELYPDFDNDGTPDIIPAGSVCADNTTATGAAVNCGGSRVWSTPTNVSTVDGNAATAALSSTVLTTHCLQVTGLGFSIPSNATITGVTATITRNASLASSAKDQTIQLIVGGTATGTNKADLVTTYPITFTAATYGSSSDLWGTTLSPAQVNVTNFGVNIRSQRTANSPTARIDGVVVTICYTTPSGNFSISTTTTAASGDIGTWYFNTSNVIDGDPSVSGNQAGLATGKKYLVRIGSADWTGGVGVSELATLALTTTNATPTAGLSDVSDNDATLSSTIPTIAYTTGSYGQNDHTLDFGFFTCIKPSGISFTKTTPTCTNGTANNNGKITLTAVSNADKYGISTGSTYTGAAYSSATTIGTMPFDVQTAIPTVGATYTIRFFNGAEACYKDTTVVFYPITCVSCTKSIMYLCGTNKPNDGVAFDHGLIDYLRAIGHTVTPASFSGGNLINVETTASINTISNFDKIVVSHSAYWEIDGNFDNILDSLKATSTSVLMLSNVAMNAMGLSVSANYEQFTGDMWIDNNTNSILPSGLSNGSLSVYNSPATVGLDGYAKIIAWGDGVGSGAIVGAYRGVQPDTRATYFGYPKGANLANNTAAPGRRFFLGTLIEGASALGTQIDVANPNNFFTANGKKILDAALENTCPCTCDTTLTVSNTTICNGSSVNLFSLASGVKGTLTYSTNGTTWTALTSPTNVTPSLTTTYYVKDTLTSGCFDVDTLVITVNPTPATPSVSTPQNNVCPTTTVNLTTISSALTPSVSGGIFEWHVSNASSSALVSSPTAVENGIYYLFEKSPTNCYSASTAVTVTILSCATPPAIPLPADNCSAPLQYLTTPCYVNGDPLAVGSTSASDHVLVNFPLTASGSLGSGGTELHRFANANQVGSTWGIASQASSGKIFSAAMLKRHVGLGPNGLGAIYESNIFTGDSISTPMTTGKFVDLVADLGLDVGQTQIAGMDLSNGAASNVARGLPADKTVNNTDGAVFSKIAKIGLGDLDIDEAEQNLFVVNLHLKKIHKINIAAKTLVASYDIPATDGASGTTMRPFGLEIAAGKLYAGVVYSKENPATIAAQDITTMTTSVYQLDLTTGIWATTPVISFPLDYAKGDVLGSLPAIDKWNVWQDNFAEWQKHNDLSIHPQPILSDMVMDNSGALHLAFMDRAGNQTGFQNNSPDNAVYSGTTDGYTGGDLLRTANVSGVLVLESNGSAGTFTGSGVGNSQGPGNGEFYSNDDKSTSHYETSWGGVAMVRSSGQIVLSIMDPFDYTAGGLKVFNTTNGSQVRAYQLYRSSSSASPTFGKANGIGGMDLICVVNCDTTLVVNNTTICKDATVNLYAQVGGVKGTLTYSTNGTTWLALTSPTNVTPSVTTTYYVKDTLTSGCFDVDTLVITVNPQPTTPSVSSPIMNICPLTTVNLTTISSALTPSVSGGVFEWHVSNSSSSAMVTNQSAVGAGDYYLFERSPAGCYSTGLKVTTAIQVCCPTPLCLPVIVTRNN